MIYLTIMIYIQEGKEEVFHQFENMALPMLQDHGGQLIFRIRPTEETFISSSEDERPYEIHFLSFQSEQGYTDYLNDERRKKFLRLKQESIKSTFVIKEAKL